MSWLFSCAVLSATLAQTAPRETTVVAPRVPTPLSRTPAAVSVVEREDIQEGRATLGLHESLVGVPGLVTQSRNNAAQDLRLSIRGFGARSAFGIRGITVLVDGFPETLPDGQSNVDSLDMGSAERVEVLRGLASSLYGNAAGGVVSITTEEGPERPFVEARSVHGDNGLWKLNVKGGGKSGDVRWMVGASRLAQQGWRRLSGTEQVLLNGKVGWTPDGSSEWKAVLSLVDAPEAGDAGGLTRAEVEDDPRQAAPLNAQYRAGESVRQGRLGLTYRRRLGEAHEVEASGFLALRRFQNALPQTVVAFDRTFDGVSVRYGNRAPLLGLRSRFTVGAEVQSQADRRKNFDNAEGRPGSVLQLDQDEGVLGLGVFAQEEWELRERLTLVAGARYDVSRYAVEDFLKEDGDGTGTRTFQQPTGRLGLIWAPVPEVSVFASATQAFEAPTTTELAVPAGTGGGLSRDLKPQRSNGVELGARGLLWGWLRYDVALFSVWLQDGLVRFEDERARAYFRNTGRSRHMGAEVALEAKVTEELRVRAAYNALQATFRDYVSQGQQLRGKRVPGIPANQVSAEAVYQHASGARAAVEVFSAGGLYADDANTVREHTAWVVNARLGHRFPMGAFEVSPFVGFQNLLSARYSDNVRVNASRGRYFEPAPPLSVYAGAGLSHRW
ncbi:iron complex outermembrane receptor protein [Archangium gephyra]|uniref:Iron complex outermembrane receptor protein n=1 Tax=Archangium gephyra TaxID=48 RepID=A0AAC8TBP0_9BACT|nr:TonB-dependent receptor [Archangium gephyra]AKJ00122.1 TonB-dependent receptor [Archangium gephyra]REG33178.1 iron complex outermembrane receptor protein [Archangium gephyra]